MIGEDSGEFGYKVICVRCYAHIAGPETAPPLKTRYGVCLRCTAEIMRESLEGKDERRKKHD